MHNSKIIALVLLLLSAFAGYWGYQFNSYSYATLVIEAKTSDLGKRLVSVVAAETGKTEVVSFVVGDDSGADSFYTIGLPSRPASIKIPPLSANGRFQINRIILKNRLISYAFNGKGECSQITKKDGVIQREACQANSPGLTVNVDQSLTISSIPAKGFENSLNVRIVTALLSSSAVLLGWIWLLWPYFRQNPASGIQEYLSRAAWMLFLAVYLYQYYQIWIHAVDVPYYEEWEYYFELGGLIDGFSWKWLFGFWDLHKIVFTKLLAWLSWQLNDLNFAAQKIISYLVFGVMLLTVTRFKEKLLGRGEFPLFVLFMIFLLSPIAYANHAVAQMSQTHFVLLFSVLAVPYAINRDISIKSALLFCLCAIASMYSYSHGLAFTAVYLVAMTCYILSGILRKTVNRKTGLSILLTSYLLIALALLFWFYGDRKPTAWALLFPTDFRFWECLLNLVGLGFGFQKEGLFSGLICLLLTLIPCLLLLLKNETRWEVETWQIVTAILGILAALGAICVGRGGLVGTDKSSRYAEFAFLLIPYASMAWWLLLRNRSWRKHFLAVFWIFCLISYRDDFATSVVYRDLEHLDNLVLECVESYVQGTGDGSCPETNPTPLGPRFERAKSFGVNFTKQFK